MPSNYSMRLDPVRLFLATNAVGGDVREYMNQGRLVTANALQRNAPRNSPLNEVHRSRGNPNYANGFRSQMYGNQNGAGFTVTNVVEHAGVVEFGRVASRRDQTFSWVGWGGEIRTVGSTRARPGTRYMSRTVERIARQRAR